MRTLALALSLAALCSCTSFTWQGQKAGLSSDEALRGVEDFAALTRKYETETYFRRLSRRQDGRANAFGRDLAHIQETIDRHFFNYSVDDPYVNFETETGVLGHMARFGTTFLAR
jgi:hypothetical protein